MNAGNAAAKQMTLRAELSNVQQQPGQTVEELAATIYNIVKQLRSSGELITAREMNQWLLKALTQDYASQVSQALTSPELIGDTLRLVAFLQQRETALRSFRPGSRYDSYPDHEYYLAMRQTSTVLPILQDRYRLPNSHPLVSRVYNQSADKERHTVSFEDEYRGRGRSPHRGYRNQTPYRSQSRSRSRSGSRDRYQSRNRYRNRSRSRDRGDRKYGSGGAWKEARLNLHEDTPMQKQGERQSYNKSRDSKDSKTQ